MLAPPRARVYPPFGGCPARTSATRPAPNTKTILMKFAKHAKSKKSAQDSPAVRR